MVNIGDKYLYTGKAQTTMSEGSKVVILRRGDRVTIKAFALKNGWVYVIIDELLFTWPVDIKFLTPLEDFPEDENAFDIFIYKFHNFLENDTDRR